MGVKDKSGGSGLGPQGESNHDKDQEILEIRVNQISMNLLSLLMLFLAANIAIVAQFPFSFEIELRFPGIDSWKLLGSLILLIIFHEALHAVAALLWGRIPWRSIHFGVKWRQLLFYCHCDKPLKVNTYRIFALFPLLVTTPIASLILWLDPSIWSLLFFSVTISACAGDVLLVFKTRQVENDKWIQDHESEPGFYILPEAIVASPEEHHR